MKLRSGFVSNSSTSSFVFNGLAVKITNKNLLDYITPDYIIENIEEIMYEPIEEYFINSVSKEDEVYLGTQKQKDMIVDYIINQDTLTNSWIEIDDKILFTDDEAELHIGYLLPDNVKPEVITKFFNKIKKKDPEFYKKCKYVTKYWEEY